MYKYCHIKINFPINKVIIIYRMKYGTNLMDISYIKITKQSTINCFLSVITIIYNGG